MRQGDSLVAEIAYQFPSLTAVEGLRITAEELFVVVPEGRVVARTNGRVETWQSHDQRIVWPRDAVRLLFQIREKDISRSTSLAGLFRAHTK